MKNNLCYACNNQNYYLLGIYKREIAKARMNEKYKNDYSFGKGKEETVLTKIRTFFNEPTIEPLTERYSRYDFCDKQGKKYELKSRRMTKDRFNTTMLPVGKLLSENPEGNIFLFQFTDGLYYIKYEEPVFSTFNIAPYCRSDREGYDIPQDYIFIPVNLLTQII